MKAPIIKINDHPLSKEDCVTFINALNCMERDLRHAQNASNEMKSIQRIWKYLSNEVE